MKYFVQMSCRFSQDFKILCREYTKYYYAFRSGSFRRSGRLSRLFVSSQHQM